jgi:hypothetical protein
MSSIPIPVARVQSDYPPEPSASAAWLRVWERGFAPQLSTRSLEALARALETDDARLITGATTSPPSLQAVSEWPVEAACPIGLSGWLGNGLESVGQVEEYFAHLCYEADRRLGEPSACRYFLNWVDDTPREEMRQALLIEVLLALVGRMPDAA